jgi:hypothetical protein
MESFRDAAMTRRTFGLAVSGNEPSGSAPGVGVWEGQLEVLLLDARRR